MLTKLATRSDVCPSRHVPRVSCHVCVSCGRSPRVYSLVQLQRLFSSLQLSVRGAVSTGDLTRSFGWRDAEAFVQHDVQECMSVIFDHLATGERVRVFFCLYVGTHGCVSCVCARARIVPPLPVRACICACCFCVCLLRARACARVTLCVRSCFLSLRQGTRRRRLGDTSSPTSRCVPVLILAAHVCQCPLPRLLSGHAVQLHSVWRVRAVP